MRFAAHVLVAVGRSHMSLPPAWRQHATATTRRPGATTSSFRTRCSDTALRAAFASEVPLRCPRTFVGASLRRVPGLSSAEAVAALRDGEAFVSVADDLIDGPKSPLLDWDLEYLRRNMPKLATWVVYNRGTDKIVMSHTNRYMTASELDALDAEGMDHAPDEKRFKPVRKAMMTIDEFVKATEKHARAVADGSVQPGRDPPYLGADMLLRQKFDDRDGVQDIGWRLRSDINRLVRCPALNRLIDAGKLPPLNQLHLFVGSACTLCARPLRSPPALLPPPYPSRSHRPPPPRRLTSAKVPLPLRPAAEPARAADRPEAVHPLPARGGRPALPLPRAPRL